MRRNHHTSTRSNTILSLKEPAMTNKRLTPFAAAISISLGFLALLALARQQSHQLRPTPSSLELFVNNYRPLADYFKPIDPSTLLPTPLIDSRATVNATGIPRALVEKGRLDAAPLKIIIDLGLNNGDSLIRDLTAAHYADVKIGFECNPKWIPQLETSAKTFNFVLYNACAWTSSGTTQLYLDEYYEDAAGTSLLSGHDRARPNLTTTVQTVDFPAMLANIVRARDTLVVKMDIEGGEFSLLRELLIRPAPLGAFLDRKQLEELARDKEGSTKLAALQKPIICLIDILYIEEHPQKGVKPAALGSSWAKEAVAWIGSEAGCKIDVRPWA